MIRAAEPCHCPTRSGRPRRSDVGCPPDRPVRSEPVRRVHCRPAVRPAAADLAGPDPARPFPPGATPGGRGESLPRAGTGADPGAAAGVDALVRRAGVQCAARPPVLGRPGGLGARRTRGRRAGPGRGDLHWVGICRGHAAGTPGGGPDVPRRRQPPAQPRPVRAPSAAVGGAAAGAAGGRVRLGSVPAGGSEGRAAGAAARAPFG